MLAARTNGRRRESPQQSCAIEHYEHHPLTLPRDFVPRVPHPPAKGRGRGFGAAGPIVKR